ncbi:Uracil DNA glycosylase superfamily protein [Caloramator mitchellensis]|uniref:Type-4 uracil-DNA glycosylase n=1 Tax=Caloramator mitchellensis TaxID=908809 RepID=A0A0R3K0M4_CALMK|nr:uracil-DNA glycosylase [Caloramator mitchellensis]KRQ85807.1 Uracil DNA glycosylase superfamily protein [Caloramator mitchellensis]
MDELILLKKEYEDLARERLGVEQKIVFGEGNIGAKIMLIGEAPGRFEEEMGRPFVGQAGKNLDEFLKILDLKREDIYITNVVKFRPFKVNEKTNKKSNRPPSKKEIEVSKVILFKEIDYIKPGIIVTLGNVPLKAIVSDKASIGEYHGKIIKVNGYTIFPLYHPASIIYNRSLYDVYIDDLKELRKVLKNGGY